jgi:hypothetical protein
MYTELEVQPRMRQLLQRTYEGPFAFRVPHMMKQGPIKQCPIICALSGLRPG